MPGSGGPTREGCGRRPAARRMVWRHGGHRQGALVMEGDILNAQGLCLLQIVEAGVATITGRLSRWRTLARDVALEHGKEALGIGRVAGLDDDIEDQAALAGGQVQLVTVMHLAAALDD